MNKEMKNTAYYKAKAGIDLTKKPTGPRATPKPSTEAAGDVDLSPSYEDPIKIQKVQREGLVPGSQKFMKRKK